MPAERDIYASHADHYERLIRREDHHGNLSRAIELVIAMEGLEVIEFGAGTGRLARMLAPRVRSIRAFDASAPMLAEADYLGWPAEAGFEAARARTDYCFESLEEAIELCTFFFGEEMGGQVRERGWGVLPECMGLYWRRF
jgi:SAM-dependent methyltransferase